MKNEIPEIIQDVGFDFSWDEKNVWSLDIPVTSVNINELIWHFDTPFHWHDGGVYNLTSKEILANPEKYRDEYKRVEDADISFPIDIMKNKGRWLILDGLHRLMKLYQAGEKEIKVRIIPRDRIPEITK